jgi:hypothetical protein
MREARTNNTRDSDNISCGYQTTINQKQQSSLCNLTLHSHDFTFPSLYILITPILHYILISYRDQLTCNGIEPETLMRQFITEYSNDHGVYQMKPFDKPTGDKFETKWVDNQMTYMCLVNFSFLKKDVMDPARDHEFSVKGETLPQILGGADKSEGKYLKLWLLF